MPGRTITGGLSGGAWSLISAHLGYSGEQLLKMWADLFTSQKAKDLLQSAAAGGPGLVGHINTLAVVRVGTLACVFLLFCEWLLWWLHVCCVCQFGGYEAGPGWPCCCMFFKDVLFKQRQSTANRSVC